jgi:hypothetical protein
VGTGFIWLRISSSGMLLWTRRWTIGFYKRQGVSWPFEWLSSFWSTQTASLNNERMKYEVARYIQLKGKGKVVPVIWLSTTPWRRIGEWRYSSTHSLTSALDGYEWSGYRPGRFTPTERDPGTHWIGGWVGPRAVLDAVVKREIPSPRRESNPKEPRSSSP